MNAVGRNSIGYAYPWDVEVDGFTDRAQAAGVGTVALAAAYHSVRAATPYDRSRTVFDASSSAWYLPVRPDRWRGSVLTPVVPNWLAAPDWFGAGRTRIADSSDLDVYAWTVLLHNSTLGREHPELTVRNAFGTSYPYALCPTQPAVIDYAGRLVAEVVELAAPDGVVLEAANWLGLDHGGEHDKTDLAGWTLTQRALLSICCCTACARRQVEHGIDPAELAATIRAAATQTPGPDRVSAALGPDLASAVITYRASVRTDLHRSVLEAISSSAGARSVRVLAFVDPDPWVTGPYTAWTAGGLDGVIASAWDATAVAVPAVRDFVATESSARPDVDPPTIAAYLRWPFGRSEVDAAAIGRALADAGADELHLYHLGLSGPNVQAQWPIVSRAFDDVRASRIA